MSKKILIISYSFPPSRKVGGRRWVKFAKYFVKSNNDVRIITSKNKNESGWIRDYNYLKSRITEISFNYPYYLGIIPKNLNQKVLYRLHLIWSKLNTSANFYDKAVHGEKELIKETIKFINKGYNNIIVTVAPFHLATHISKIISDYPQCNFIVDFRDPWIGNKTDYGYYSLSKFRQSKEKKSEQKVVNSFDHVVTVSKKITDEFKVKYPNSNTKFHTIPNGFDKDDILKNYCLNKEDEKIRLIFTGNLYDNAKKYFTFFIKLIEGIKNIDYEFFHKIEINFFGVHYFPEITLKNIYFNGVVTNEVINKQIQTADACLLFLTDDINYSFSTKFCEYVSYEKPILIFSNDGFTSKFIEHNKLGHSLTINNNVKDLIYFLKSVKENKEYYYQNFSKNSFDLNYLFEKYIDLLI